MPRGRGRARSRRREGAGEELREEPPVSRGSAGTEAGVGQGVNCSGQGSAWVGEPARLRPRSRRGRRLRCRGADGVPGDGTASSSRLGLNPCRGCVGGGQRQLRGRGRRCPRRCVSGAGAAGLERDPRAERRRGRGARLMFNAAVTCPAASSPALLPEAVCLEQEMPVQVVLELFEI